MRTLSFFKFFCLRQILIPLSTVYRHYHEHIGAGIAPISYVYLDVYVFCIRVARFQQR
ncbi:MAG: hypothetical protein ABSG67_01420 [Thermoguttaceae bacterium]